VHGEGGRQDRLPLPIDVGAAIVDYLRHERPPRTSRSVFILAVAPRTGISAKTVGGLVRCTGARAGLAPIGPHRLRHTAATEMLRGGASLAEIGQVLRHQRHRRGGAMSSPCRAAHQDGERARGAQHAGITLSGGAQTAVAGQG